MDSSKSTNPFIITTFAILLFGAVMNMDHVIEFIGYIINFCMPLIIGSILAFILNVPMKVIEKQVQKVKKLEKASRIISIISTLLIILAVLALVVTIVIPELLTSIKTVVPLLEAKWYILVDFLKQYEIDLSNIKFESLIPNTGKILSGAGSVIGSALEFASSTVNIALNFCFGLVIMVYGLLSKDLLKKQLKRLLFANLKKETAKKICYIGRLSCETYTKFLSGQAIEAVVLGSLIGIAFSIFKIPYAVLIGFMTTILSFIPYVGAFLSCFIGLILILLVNPYKVVLAAIVYCVVQFIENQFIYPQVVGSSVGLPPIGIVISVLTGAKLFGIVGIIFFIPLMSVICTLINENTTKKLKERKIYGI